MLNNLTIKKVKLFTDIKVKIIIENIVFVVNVVYVVYIKKIVSVMRTIGDAGPYEDVIPSKTRNL